MNYTVVRETWLSRRVGTSSVLVAVGTTFVMALVSFGYWWNIGNMQTWTTASGRQVFERHEWWRAWTTLLIHANFGHLVSNSFLFLILGVFLFAYFGWFVFPFVAFFVGGLFNLAVLRTMPPDVTLLGASGVVFWMGGFWLTLYCFLERTRTRGDRGLRAVGVGLALFMPAETFDPQISYISHLLGFLTGLLCGILYFYLFRRKFRAAEVWETVIEAEEPVSPES